MSKILGAIEIGTSRSKVLIGELTETGNLNVLSAAAAPNEGVRKGEISDFRKAAASAHAAIREAEKSAGTTVDAVYLAQTGSHLRGHSLRGHASIAASDNVVEEEDLRRAEEEAKRKQPEKGRCYVHHVRAPVMLDGQIVEDPVGKRGANLEVGYWAIDGDKNPIQEATDVVMGYSGLDIVDVFVSSIASGAILAGPDLQRAGALVVDIGAGTTDYVLYRHGHVAITGVVAVGGDHLTGDLGMGLRVHEHYAEQLKLEHGKALTEENDAKEEVWLIGNKTIGDRSVSRKAICDIIHARVVELFEIIGKELGDLLDPAEVASGVLLTGGGSRLPGIEQVASKVLGLSARRAAFPAGILGELADPANATVLGLLHFGLKDGESRASPASPSFFRKITRFVGIG